MLRQPVVLKFYNWALSDENYYFGDVFVIWHNQGEVYNRYKSLVFSEDST